MQKCTRHRQNGINKRNKRSAYAGRFVIGRVPSCVPGEIIPEEANRLGVEFVWNAVA